MRSRSARWTKGAFVLSCLCSACRLYREGNPCQAGDFPAGWQRPERLRHGSVVPFSLSSASASRTEYPRKQFLRPRASGIGTDARNQRAAGHGWSRSAGGASGGERQVYLGRAPGKRWPGAAREVRKPAGSGSPGGGPRRGRSAPHPDPRGPRGRALNGAVSWKAPGRPSKEGWRWEIEIQKSCCGESMWVFVYTGSSLPPLTPFSLSSLLVWERIFLLLVNTKDIWGKMDNSYHVKMKLFSSTATYKKMSQRQTGEIFVTP